MSARICTGSLLIVNTRRRPYETYASLKVSNLFVCQSVRLGNDRDKVNLGVKLPHELDINRLQAAERVMEVLNSGLQVLTSGRSAE